MRTSKPPGLGSCPYSAAFDTLCLRYSSVAAVSASLQADDLPFLSCLPLMCPAEPGERPLGTPELRKMRAVVARQSRRNRAAMTRLLHDAAG